MTERRYDGAQITILLRDGGRGSVDLRNSDLDVLCEEQDLPVDDPGSWHAALALLLESSLAGDEFYLEGETTLHIRRAEDIVGFMIYPKVPRISPASKALAEDGAKDRQKIRERGGYGLIYGIVSLLAISVIVTLQYL